MIKGRLERTLDDSRSFSEMNCNRALLCFKKKDNKNEY